METNADVRERLDSVLASADTRLIVFNVALCDFEGEIDNIVSGKYAPRLKTREIDPEGLLLRLRPADKLLGRVHSRRPDVHTVGFKTTAGADVHEQARRALALADEHHLTWVLANDTVTRTNLVYGPMRGAEASLKAQTSDRTAALRTLAHSCTELLRG